MEGWLAGTHIGVAVQNEHTEEIRLQKIEVVCKVNPESHSMQHAAHALDRLQICGLQ